MNRTTALGIALLGIGLVGYVTGVYVPYPGRGFSITAVMVGLTLAAIAASHAGASAG